MGPYTLCPVSPHSCPQNIAIGWLAGWFLVASSFCSYQHGSNPTLDRNLVRFLFPLLFPRGRDRLVGLVVKASASRAEGPGFESRLRPDFSRSSHTSDLKIGTPVATLPGAWRYRVSTGTGRPGVSIL